MTNKEKYHRAFSTLHASGDISLEVDFMKKRKHAYRMKKAVAACAAAAVVCGSMTVAYAADIGGIQQKMRAWLHGEQTEINVRRTGENSYRYTYTDENGKVIEGGAAAVGIDENGKETSFSAEDVLADVGNGLEVLEDGSVWYYYDDKKFNLTDLFDQDGNCKFMFYHGGGVRYITCRIHQPEEESMLDEENGISYATSCESSISEEAPEDVQDYILLEERR